MTPAARLAQMCGVAMLTVGLAQLDGALLLLGAATAALSALGEWGLAAEIRD